MTDNLALWHSVERTPQEHTKAITGKSYSGTSPKPHYLVHKATETFGPCGIGWGFHIVSERIEDGAAPGERMHIALVRVWYEWQGKRGEVEHIGGTPFSGVRSSGKTFIDEDAPKKSVTDALVKALSMIGFAGDIFMGRYDDSKYIAELREEARAAKEQPASAPRQSAPAKEPIDPAESEQAREFIIKTMDILETTAEFDEWGKANAAQIGKLLPKDQDLVRQAFKTRRHATHKYEMENAA